MTRSDLRRRVWEILEHGRAGDRVARAVHAGILTLIVVNITAVVLETVPRLAAAYEPWFSAIELVSVVLFAAEYALRLWVAPEHPAFRHRPAARARWRYLRSPAAIIDFIAVAPFVLAFLVPADVRALVVIRLVRFLKLARYSPGLRSLMDALVAERRALFGCLVITLGFVLVFASLMHLVEQAAQPDKFGTLPDAMWWAVVTLATVGYGDAVPITSLGKFVASGAVLSSFILMALPVGIIATAFAEEIHRRDFVVTWGMVARVPLFAELDAVEIASITRLLRAQTFEPGAAVCRRGEPAHSMYFITAGEVEIELPYRHRRLREGHFFGERAVLAGTRRSADVTAITRTSLLVLDAEDLHALLERNPHIGKSVREIAAARLADQNKQRAAAEAAVTTSDPAVDGKPQGA